MSKTNPSAPTHLSDSSRQFYEHVQRAYAITDDAGLELLRLAAESLDTAAAARQAIAEHGQTYTDRFGQPRSRPEVAIVRDSVATFTRLIRTLGIDIPDPKGKP